MPPTTDPPLEKIDQNTLQKMNPDVSFYHEDEDGNVLLRRAWVSVGQDKFNNELAAAACVALALTEFCCERGIGKVC